MKKEGWIGPTNTHTLKSHTWSDKLKDIGTAFNSAVMRNDQYSEDMALEKLDKLSKKQRRSFEIGDMK